MLATSVSGRFCISVVASALGGVLGMASGIFIAPILTIVAGLDVSHRSQHRFRDSLLLWSTAKKYPIVPA